MTKKKYELTDEHRAQLAPWAERWIQNALSCKPMDDEDRAAMRDGLVSFCNKNPHLVFIQEA